MTKFILISVLIFLTGCQSSPGARSDYYYHKRSFFETNGDTNFDIVFIGDSITDYAEWHELIPDLKVANRGISGDKTDGVLDRIDSIVSTQAPYAFIMIGVNDFRKGRAIEDVKRDYDSILNELTSHNMMVFVQSTLYTGSNRKNLNDNIRSLNLYLESRSMEDNMLTFVDLTEYLSEDGLLPSTLSRDGLHLNGTAYSIWKNALQIHLDIIRSANQ